MSYFLLSSVNCVNLHGLAGLGVSENKGKYLFKEIHPQHSWHMYLHTFVRDIGALKIAFLFVCSIEKKQFKQFQS